ncbi:mucin-6-like [Oppia nitens]|uniref:mucin-6-like n=1 Tax=Oppia nitens TaxID=1686743 RepID=UPI0023DA1D05|nr:mucin-6-like [Oppia nitens]XP_054156993.1 mucin-6-like [Oppia nitens]
MSTKLIVLFAIIFCSAICGRAQERDCLANEVYNSCGSACPETCESVRNPNSATQACTMNCVAGCFCRDGYVKDNNQCVPRQNCLPSGATGSISESRKTAAGDRESASGGDSAGHSAIHVHSFGTQLIAIVATFLLYLTVKMLY